MGVDILGAIHGAASLEIFKGCLGECAAGNLTKEEVEEVRVADASNYGMLAQASVPGQPSKPFPKLTLVLAQDNIAVQRAVVSHHETDLCMMQLGTCVHCAVRAALIQGVEVLID